jgi:hypothetical protein
MRLLGELGAGHALLIASLVHLRFKNDLKIEFKLG